MSKIAIRAEGLGKKYHIGAKQREFRTLSERIAHAARTPFRRARKLLRGQATGAAELDEVIWALKEISFDVAAGEVVGIIGSNGAGKSTLLKIVSRITDPTEGHVDIYGTVGSLLEVGTGFHPELTGRENVFLNGAILGMRRSEIEQKFDKIVAFAEVQKFMDTPVKHFSSGMYVRLAFAVAAHLDPEILLVDEVLSVGDAAFQQKCLGKMGNVATAGRTVLFVSHNMAAIGRLCDRVIWLDDGSARMDGPAKKVIAAYLASGASAEGERVWNEGFSKADVDEFKLDAVRLLDAQDECTNQFSADEPIQVAITYRLLERTPVCRVGFMLVTPDGVTVLDAYDTDDDRFAIPRRPGRYESRCTIPGHLLAPGRYFVTVNAGVERVKHFALAHNVIGFDILEQGAVGENQLGNRLGMFRPRLDWAQEELTRPAERMSV